MENLNLLERSIVAPFINEEDKETISIYPGAFKPPHRGHLAVLEKANAIADKTIVLISSAPREDVEAEESLKIWELYTKDMPNVEVKISERFSPVAEAYSLFKHNPEKNFNMVIGKGEVSRLDNLEKYSNAKPFDAGTLEDLSATRLRKAIREGDTETIQRFIPKNISVEEYLGAFDQAPINEEEGKMPSQDQVDKFFSLTQNEMHYLNQKPVAGQKGSLTHREIEPWDEYDLSNFNALVRKAKKTGKIQEDCYPEHFLQDSITSFAQYMEDSGMQVAPAPRVEFVMDDEENAADLLGKTAYYNPEEQVVVLYTLGRHPKDILRSFAHEMIHHIQNLEGRLGNIQTTNTNEDSHLDEIEREAYEHGNITFRNWTDSILNDESVNEDVIPDNEIEDLISQAVKHNDKEKIKEGAIAATVVAFPILLKLAGKLAKKLSNKFNSSKLEAGGDKLVKWGKSLHKAYTWPVRKFLQGISHFTPKGNKLKDKAFREKIANIIYASIMIYVAGDGIYDAIKNFSGIPEAYTAMVEATEGGASVLEVIESALESINAIGELKGR